jgi:hypothetical protein
MQLVRPFIATNPRLFGRGPVREVETAPVAELSLSDDVKLFAMTFLAGFLFVSILIG